MQVLPGTFRTSIAPTFTENDASGGLGSFFDDVRSVLTGGLSAAVRGEITKRYGPNSFIDGPTVTADGEVRPAGAPSPPPKVSEQYAEALRGVLSNPFVLVAAAVLAAVVVARLARS